jgi:luciferase family oxidoreductase group 1
MKISIVDTSPELAGSTAIEAFRTTVELAQLADQAGFSRYWLSELHGVLTNAGAAPEVAVAAVTSRTSNLRVGSGGVLLNHRSPYRVAETFLQLHAMFPGRIDLGIGCATSGRMVDFALQQTRSAVLPEENYEDRVVELLHWFDGFDDDHPFAKVPFFEGVFGRPEPWILGSSPSSAVVAARLGLAYCFAAFLNPAAAQISLATCRREFRPSPFRAGLAKPYSMLGVNVVCAETEREALRVQAAGELVRRLAEAGRLPNGVPSAADAIDQLGGPPEPTRYVPGSWPRSVAAAPSRLRELLDAMVAEVQADELIIQDLIGTPSDRLASYRLIAEAFDLPGGAPRQAATAAGSPLAGDAHAG